MKFSPNLRFAIVCFTVGCQSPKTREWTPEDHDHAGANNVAQTPAPVGSAAKNNDQILIDTVWMNRCASCHGVNGHGDGPNGPMVRAPNLLGENYVQSRPPSEWPSSIRNGRGKMPSFQDLPDKVVQGLVARLLARRSGASNQP